MLRQESLRGTVVDMSKSERVSGAQRVKSCCTRRYCTEVESLSGWHLRTRCWRQAWVSELWIFSKIDESLGLYSFHRSSFHRSQDPLLA